MSFVTASLAIAGVLAASIPIIIHLLSRQRRKPIQWAAMRFLLEAMRKHRRRLRTEQLLLLAVRCLIVLLFGAALARPLLTQAGILSAGGDRMVYLLIDNGMASGVTDEVGRSALEGTRQQAIEIIRALQPGDRVSVATTARPARLDIWPPTTDHGSAMQYINSLRPTDAPTDVPGTMRELRNALDEQEDERSQVIVYLLSEFRAGSAPLESPLPQIFRELSDRVSFVASEPAQAAAPNVQITSIDPVRHIVLPGAADGSGQITVRLERHGGSLEQDVTRVRLSGEGISSAEPRVIRWEPGQSQASVDFIVAWVSRSATGEAAARREVALSAHIDDDFLNADNSRHAILELRDQLRVALLDRRGFGIEPTIEGFHSGQWIRRALEPFEGSPVQITAVEPGAVSAADVRTADVVIAARADLLNEAGWETLREYVDRGGVLMVMPPDELNVHPWAERFTQAMDLPWRISAETQVHERGLPLATEQPNASLLRLISSEIEELVRPVSAQRTLPVEAESGEPLLVFDNGAPLLIAAIPGQVRQTPAVDETAESDAPTSPARSQSRGLVIYMAAAPQLNWTNLPGKPLMVPLMHELVRQSAGSVRAAGQMLTGDRPVISPGAAARELIEAPAQSRNRERMRITLNDEGRPVEPLTHAGVFEARDAAGQLISMHAVNVDPRAGRTQTLAQPALLSWLAGALPPTDRAWTILDQSNPAAALGTTEGGSPIAWLLLWIVLGLVLVETLLQRWFSHATSSAPAPQRRRERSSEPKAGRLAGGAA